MTTGTNIQDKFYSSIAEHYSSIFPFNAAQLSFLENESAPMEGKKFLDAGCGSGELAFALAQKGADVLGIDLNDALLEQARNRRDHRRITYLKGNMLDIGELAEQSSFDGVICFGNTLVHLENTEQISSFFRAVMYVLKPDGKFFLQILHYDHIFRYKIETLPLIENESIRFERCYRFLPGFPYIRFITRLTLKQTGESIENETELLGMGTEDLTRALREAGFTDIALYGDFLKNPFGGKHLPLVLACRNNA